ncbi:MAG: hypothetical protein IT364_19090 [Candidatus Hydrogenedentes bacterium]|nr:hypothetical protein [Candidatus Hydrogenedentota bacterium]
MRFHTILGAFAALIAFSGLPSAVAVDVVDLSHAAIVVPDGNAVLAKAAQMLGEEVQRRTGIELPVSGQLGSPQAPSIVLGTVAALPSSVELPSAVQVPEDAEGYTLLVDSPSEKAPVAYLIGRDERGALFAAGRFIREARLEKGAIMLPPALAISSEPRYPMRGHQIGYRPTANSYDAWDLKTYEQYVRDCVIFGSNSIEIIPSLRENDLRASVMPVPQEAMNVQIAEMLHSYGLDVWLFIGLDGDVQKPEEWRSELEARDRLFALLPAVDHVMVPGGDPGHTEPAILMPWLQEMAAVLHKHFPKAGLWVSNQGFTDEQNEVFFKYLHEKQPDWLAGVVFGPWTKIDAREERERTPSRYPIRLYPDITHCIRCQYPVPEWDPAFAQTIGREPTNPRATESAHIHNVTASFANGFVSYSDGCHDDLNKMIWSAFAWDPDADVKGIVRDYARVFFGEAYADDAAEGIWMLEANWRGSAAKNEGIDKTLDHWIALGQRAGADLADNWRFQLYLLRAMSDAYVRARVIAEAAQDEQVYAALDRAKTDGVKKALRAAAEILEADGEFRVRQDLRVRIEELALKMNQSIGMQYSIYEPYLASNSERNALLDNIDRPLNDRLWLAKQIEAIGELKSEKKQLAQIDVLVHWESPAPGAIYDDLGCAWKQPHLVRQVTWAEDPGYVHGPQEEHNISVDKFSRKASDDRLSWLDQAQTQFGTPLQMRYEGLDSKAAYRIRITYAGRYKASMRLVADGMHEIHGPLPQPDPVWPVEFDVPRAATEDGTLDLEWQLAEGRGCQVAEVWLIPQP